MSRCFSAAAAHVPHRASARKGSPGAGSGSGLQPAAPGGRDADTSYRDMRLPAAHILATLFTGNLIGIVCARTLHYQFYSW